MNSKIQKHTHARTHEINELLLSLVLVHAPIEFQFSIEDFRQQFQQQKKEKTKSEDERTK